MSRGSCTPLLMVALAVPGAAHALGLGDIRVNSALNEPLSAQVDIVGATNEELKALRVAIADEEGFRRYNAERPSYLSTVSIRVGSDAQGRPVLNLHSDAAFTDPVVELLVDVRWSGGELIRDYSLLLDPAEFRVASAPVIASPQAVAPVASTAAPTSTLIVLPAKAAPVVHAPAVVVPASGSIVLPTGYRVRARDTLSRIVRRLGVVNDTEAQRMMIALFRDNPQAFDGNINLLHRDALLAMPTPAELAAIDAAQARRDVSVHMSAWRHAAAVQSARTQLPARDPDPAPVPVPALVATPAEARVSTPVRDASVASTAADGPPVTTDRGLERASTDATGSAAPTSEAVGSEAATSDTTTAALATDAPQAGAFVPAPAAAAPAVATASADDGELHVARRIPLWTTLLRFVVFPLVLLLLAGLALRAFTNLMRGRARTEAGEQPQDRLEQAWARPAGPSAGDVLVERGTHAPAAEATLELPVAEDSPTVRLQPAGEETVLMSEATQPVETQGPGDTAEITAEMAAASGATTSSRTLDMATVVLEGVPDEDTILDVGILRSELARAQETVLDYNLLDLDATAQHVHIPSELTDRPTFVERRTNVAEALRAAIARDPTRSDLRMKLMETYFSSAATNRRAFTEYVRTQASDPQALTADDWQKIALMGRELGLDLPLPAIEPDDDLANCA